MLYSYDIELHDEGEIGGYMPKVKKISKHDIKSEMSDMRKAMNQRSNV